MQQFHSWAYTWKIPKPLIWKDNMHPHIHSSTIYTCQDMGATQVPINRWMNEDVVYINAMEYYSAMKKKEILLLATMYKLCPNSFATPWTVAFQVPLSMGFPRQQYWSGLPFLSPGDLPDPGIEPVPPASAGGFFTTEPPEKPWKGRNLCIFFFKT